MGLTPSPSLLSLVSKQALTIDLPLEDNTVLVGTAPRTCRKGESDRQQSLLRITVMLLLIAAVCLPFLTFFRNVTEEWFSDPNFSFGMLIPLISAFFIWRIWGMLKKMDRTPWNGGLLFLLLGGVLALMGSLGGVQLVSGAALVSVLLGAAGLFLGRQIVKAIAPSVLYLMLMVPWPSYTMGQLDWRLQAYASTISSIILDRLGVVNFQDGNILHFPHFALAIKEACSGTKSLFALVAFAIAIGFVKERRWGMCFLVAVAPLAALAANIVRIVGTGIAANEWGAIAAEEWLHMVWGMLVFILAAGAIWVAQRSFRWIDSKFARAS